MFLLSTSSQVFSIKAYTAIPFFLSLIKLCLWRLDKLYFLVFLAINLENLDNLGILYIFVAYELLRRSMKVGNVGSTSYIQYSPSQYKRDSDLKQMNPVKSSLEEDVVAKMAPLGHSDASAYIDSSFKPVSENIHNAFSV